MGFVTKAAEQLQSENELKTVCVFLLPDSAAEYCKLFAVKLV